MKRNEELSVIKEEIETVNKKFSELTENERKQVAGGEGVISCWWPECGGLLKQLTEFIDPYPVYICTVCKKIFDERPQPVTETI